MKKPKIEFGVTREDTERSRKLVFSAQSQEAARRRMEETKKNRERVPMKVVQLKSSTSTSTIYQTENEPAKEKDLRISIEDSTLIPSEQREYYRSQAQSERPISHSKSLTNSHSETIEDRNLANQKENEDKPNDEENYPFFPGIYPSLYRPEDRERSVMNSRIHEWEEDERYLDLGPVYEEKKPSIQVRQRWKVEDDKQQDNVFDEPDGKYRIVERFKLVLSVLGAIALGSLFGYLMLLIVLAGDGISELEKTNEMVEETIITENSVDINVKQGGTVAVGTLTVADRTFYAIQAGVFTEEKSGNSAYQMFKQKDLPTLLFQDDVYRIFLGIGYLEEDAINVSQFYRSIGSEIYLKKYTVPGGKVEIPGATLNQMEILNKYFTHGTYLLEKTAGWTGAFLDGNVKITEEAWRKFKETHQTFLNENDELMAFLPETQKQQIQMMTQEMDKAVVTMVEFIESNDRSKLVASQQALLNYFDGYQSFLKAYQNL